MKNAISIGYFSEAVNVAIDEHDTPYYGMDNADLISTPYHKYRGTDMAYRFATLESVRRDSRLTVSVMRKTPLDGIDNAREAGMLIRHAIDPGIRIGFVLIDRGYLDAAVMKTVDDMNLKYIVPAKENSKVKKFKDMDMRYSDRIRAGYLILRDTISSGKTGVESNFVHIIYYTGKGDFHRKHDFSLYTNADVSESTVLEFAELYRTRWSIENGYLEKKDTGERTHSPDMHVRRFLFLFSVLIYNLWILLNMIRALNGQDHIILMDFLIAMRRGRFSAMLKDHG